jgi:hypothetical protein
MGAASAALFGLELALALGLKSVREDFLFL